MDLTCLVLIVPVGGGSVISVGNVFLCTLGFSIPIMHRMNATAYLSTAADVTCESLDGHSLHMS